MNKARWARTGTLISAGPLSDRRFRKCILGMWWTFSTLGCAVVLSVPQVAWAQFRGPARVAVEPAQMQSVAAGQEFVGTVVPARTAIVGSAVDGRVIEFPINEGDRVEAGDTLARLLTETV